MDRRVKRLIRFIREEWRERGEMWVYALLLFLGKKIIYKKTMREEEYRNILKTIV